jgi:glutathione peroxidase
MTNLHELSIHTLDGQTKRLSDYKGKVVLVVNVASKCGYTPQYQGLEQLHRKMKDRGLVVVGVPCNQFAHQEPGTPDQIQLFCSSRYDVTFDIMEKVDVNGDHAHPLYAWMTAQDTPNGRGAVKWNFEKFIVGKDGHVLNRFKSGTTPDDTALVAAIQQALG